MDQNKVVHSSILKSRKPNHESFMHELFFVHIIWPDLENDDLQKLNMLPHLCQYKHYELVCV